MSIFIDAKPIWTFKSAEPDEFAEFLTEFEAKENCRLYISAGSDYNVYLNGRLVAFGQYADYPAHRFYDIIELSNCLKDSKNELRIVVWYYGVHSQTHIASSAYLIFGLRDGSGRLIASSNSSVLSRPAFGYISHKRTQITTQLGLSWHYNAADEEGLYSPSRELDEPNCEWQPRPIERLSLLDKLDGKLIAHGSFSIPEGVTNPASIMQRSTFGDLDAPDRDGEYYIFDLGREEVGFPALSFSAECDTDILIGWGEHLDDGRCRTDVRNFCCDYRAKAGKNDFLGSFRRFGCRYIQLFVFGKISDVNVGLRPTIYPLSYRPSHLEGIRQRIYDTAVHTLECCMHEHYEDCPWREQALYTLDSRNQMLCGYYAFGEYRFARAALRLMPYGRRPDGLLPLCFPAGLDVPIPCYSLAYFIQMNEYIKYSGDKALAEELFDFMAELISVFTDKLGDGKLINGFPNYWNFYEWSDGMSGDMHDKGIAVEAPLNAFLVLALEALAEICETLSRDKTAYDKLSKRVREGLREQFFNPEIGLFESYSDRLHGNYSVLTNSLCLLCGAAEGLDKTNILKILAANGQSDLACTVVPNTLAMNSFRFDALLREDKAKYTPIILAELDRDYTYMLERGATTFWETIVGASDFHGAGSLCHGWSALPIYYYSILS